MSQRLNDYFVNEAGEYLEQLERLLLLREEVPDAEQLVRLARGVRGSARMAGAETFASVAERLEDAARSVATRNIVWSEEIRELVLQTTRDLQILLRALNRWGPSEEARVRAALERWDEREGDLRLESSTAAPAVVPISTLFYDDEGPHMIHVPGGEDAAGEGISGEEAVPIESLLLRGPAAAEAALALRPRLQAALAGGSADALRTLHDELFDLLALSISDAPA